MSITVFDVARFFIAKIQTAGEANISITKLMKLIYYAQGVYLATHNVPLFEEDLKAWQYGPVSPQVFTKFNKKGISWFFDTDNAKVIEDKSVIEVLEGVWKIFGSLSASKLVAMTHEETPWLDTIRHETISKSSLRDYFKKMGASESA
jgi:uncharacterized phage-associated protein